MVQLHVGAGARRFLLLGALIHLIRAHRPVRGTLVFKIPARTSTMPFLSGRESTTACWSTPRSRPPGGLDLFQRYKLALGLLFLGTVHPSCSVSLQAISRVRTAGGGVGLFIFLDAAARPSGHMPGSAHHLHQLMGFAAFGWLPALPRPLFDQCITAFSRHFPGMLCFIAGLFFVLSGFGCSFKSSSWARTLSSRLSSLDI